MESDIKDKELTIKAVEDLAINDEVKGLYDSNIFIFNFLVAFEEHGIVKSLVDDVRKMK